MREEHPNSRFLRHASESLALAKDLYEGGYTATQVARMVSVLAWLKTIGRHPVVVRAPKRIILRDGEVCYYIGRQGAVRRGKTFTDSLPLSIGRGGVFPFVEREVKMAVRRAKA